jgi:hypothetical protein
LKFEFSFIIASFPFFSCVPNTTSRYKEKRVEQKHDKSNHTNI